MSRPFGRRRQSILRPLG